MVFAPPEDLSIYYLQGRVSDKTFQGNPCFLGNWEEDGCAFLFFSRPALDQVQALVKKDPQLRLKDHFQTSYEEWLGTKVQGFQAGPLQIHPIWEQVPEDQAELCPIRLDPGVVFGAGNHQTTRDCLAALLDIIQRKNQEGQGLNTVLDLGCGSGLLALAAARLGCPRVVAVDLNPLAVRTCLRNIFLNRLQSQVLAIQARAEDCVRWKADLLLANIHDDVLKAVINDPEFFRKKWFILSGLLRSQARGVLDRLNKTGSRVIRVWDEDGTWFTLLGRNKPSGVSIGHRPEP